LLSLRVIANVHRSTGEMVLNARAYQCGQQPCSSCKRVDPCGCRLPLPDRLLALA
jgi:hypothetical protein